MKRILMIALVAALSLGLAAAAFAQTGDEKLDAAKLAAKQPGLAPKTGHYCTNPQDHHPALFALAQQYNWPYEEVLRWFCEGRFGVGEIQHAFETWVAIDHRLTPNEILALKVQLGGWGQVWQQLGVKGGGNGANSHTKNK
jgi:hypothetical protein